MSLLDRSKWEKLIDKKNLSGHEALQAVKKAGHALKYVSDQTEEICLEAVKYNGLALRYVQDQTEAICLEAVKTDGYTLQYVQNQTEEICLEAVKENGHALKYVDVRFLDAPKDMTISEIQEILGYEIKIIE